MRRLPTFAHTTLLPLTLCALALAPLSGCEQTLTHEDDHGGDDTLAFAGDASALLPPDADGWAATPLLEDHEGFSRVGLRFDAGAAVSVEARFRAMGEATFSEWMPVTLTYQDGIAHNALVDAPFVADAAEVRFLAPTEARLTFAAVDLVNRIAGADDEGPVDVEANGAFEGALAADGLVVTRSQWGARSRNCGPSHSPNRLTIHHTVSPNDDSMTMAARLRQIQAYHIDVRKYCDIGYHFLIGQDGLIYQGRPERTVGAHALGANTNNVGISFVGDFSSREPSRAQLEAAARIMRALSTEYGITLNRTNVKGHRQVGQTSTECPGQRLYNRLQELIDIAKSSTGTSPSPGTPNPPPTGGAPGCFSSTLGANVDHGSCVQVTYEGCGQNGCAWYTCSAGAWLCTDRDSCEDTASYPNAACGAPSAPVYDECSSATLGRDVEHGTCVQVNRPGCGLDACSWQRCHDGSWQCSDLNTCGTDNAFAHAACDVSDEPEPPPSTVSASYVDLPPSHPAFAAAEALRSVGALWGCSTNQFCPDRLVTRAEVAYLFQQLLPNAGSGPTTPLFDDVPASVWYFSAVQALASKSIITSCGTRQFCPDEGVSRAGAAVFLRRAEGLPNTGPATPTFIDVPTGHWAYSNIESTYAAGLVTACSSVGPKFCPGDFLTRADAAVLFARVYLGVQ